MKRKVLALLLTVMMIVPAVAMVANAENHPFYPYLDDVVPATKTVTSSDGNYSITASAVNSGDMGGTGYAGEGYIIASYKDTYSGAGAVGNNRLILAEPAYWLTGLTGNGDYANTNGIDPKMQVATDYRTAINNSYVSYAPLGVASGSVWNYVTGYGATSNSFAFSTDPIGRVTQTNTDGEKGYVVENGAIQNGFAITLSSEGVTNNCEIQAVGGYGIKATKYYAAIFENGEIIAYDEGALDDSVNTYLYLEPENYGLYYLFNKFSFDGTTLSFLCGDFAFGNNRTLTFNASTGEGWENIERLSTTDSFYKGIMVSSPAQVDNAVSPSYNGSAWGCSSFILNNLNEGGTIPAMAPETYDWEATDEFQALSDIGQNGFWIAKNEGRRALRVKFQANLSSLFNTTGYTIVESDKIGAPEHNMFYKEFGVAVKKGNSKPDLNPDGTSKGATTASIPIVKNGTQVGNISQTRGTDKVFYSVFLYNISNGTQRYRFCQYVVIDVDGTNHLIRPTAVGSQRYDNITTIVEA